VNGVKAAHVVEREALEISAKIANWKILNMFINNFRYNMSLDYMKLRLAHELVIVSGESSRKTTLDHHLIKVGTLQRPRHSSIG
jgi:hypothetical protein